MKISTSAFSVVAAALMATHGIHSVFAYYETSFTAERTPTYDDFEVVKANITDWIDRSSCPTSDTDEFEYHWDNDGSRTGDCILFKRQRNPDPLGSRLVRHAFHDAVGGFDGFVNLHDTLENGGLDSSFEVLKLRYNDIVLSDGKLVNEVISMADFTAWAAQTAILEAARRQEGQNDIIPDIPVRYGRISYIEDNSADTGPTETFPPFGTASTGNEIADFFEQEFNFSKRETVTLMGIHTFGGARKVESGHTGMWTQSKNRLNNDYQNQIIFPIPIYCDAPEAQGEDDCLYLSVNGNNRSLDLTQCKPEYPDQCNGWEQVLIPNRAAENQHHGDKFQWRHSCDLNGDNCTHIMLNLDMGLYRDFEGHICTEDDETNNVVGAKGESCQQGMVKSYPVGSSCDIASSRILATCFNLHQTTDPEESLADFIQEDADDMESWINAFAPLFDELLSHKLYGGLTKDDLTELVATVLVSNGEECPSECWSDAEASNDHVACAGCQGGYCKFRSNKTPTHQCTNGSGGGGGGRGRGLLRGERAD